MNGCVYFSCFQVLMPLSKLPLSRWFLTLFLSYVSILKRQGLFSWVWHNLILNQRFLNEEPFACFAYFTFFVSQISFVHQKGIMKQKEQHMKLFSNG